MAAPLSGRTLGLSWGPVSYVAARNERAVRREDATPRTRCRRSPAAARGSALRHVATHPRSNCLRAVKTGCLNEADNALAALALPPTGNVEWLGGDQGSNPVRTTSGIVGGKLAAGNALAAKPQAYTQFQRVVSVLRAQLGVLAESFGSAASQIRTCP